MTDTLAYHALPLIVEVDGEAETASAASVVINVIADTFALHSNFWLSEVIKNLR